MFGIAKYLDTGESHAGEAQAFLCKDDLPLSRAFDKHDVYQCSGSAGYLSNLPV